MHHTHLEPTHHVAMLRFEGDVDGPELLAALQDCLEDPRWLAGMDLLWDCRRVNSLVLTPEDLAAIMSLRIEQVDGRDVSIVARPVDELIATLYQRMAKARGHESVVCHSLEEAFEVLGVPAEARGALGA